MAQYISAVIGRGFGDEGKGLATDYLCRKAKNSLVIKHNGGAQAGHTVELSEKEKDRFVFHQLGSGSFRQADTFWAETYYPDLYKLSEEYNLFADQTGLMPVIYSDPYTNIVLVTDVLLNLSVETLRGDSRHGSCGMGINEADLRTKAGYGITMSQVAEWNVDKLYERIKEIRNSYYPDRLNELNMKELPSEYKEVFESDDVIYNSARIIKENSRLITLSSACELLPQYENVVFESGQGLLLDAMCEKNYPHVTASRTGLTNIMLILDKCGLELDEVIYVTRSYVTRHGAGPLDNMMSPAQIAPDISDKTNRPNPWQGSLRYGLYSSADDIELPVVDDIKPFRNRHFKKSLLITHLNETEGMIKCLRKDLSAYSYKNKQTFFDNVYFSSTPYAEDIQ